MMKIKLLQTFKHLKIQFFVIILSFAATSALMAQTNQPKGVYKLSEIIHQDGKHLEAQFKQCKFCLDKYSLTVGYNSVVFESDPIDFGLSNPDGKPLQFTGELSKTENNGIQLFSTSDSTFTLRWFNDRSAFNEHLFPYGTNIDEIYVQVKDSDDVMLRSCNLLQMKFGTKKHRLQGVWKLRGKQQTNTATSQYWIEKAGQETYQIFGSREMITVYGNASFPRTNLQCRFSPCTYLSEYAYDIDGQTSVVNWFDDETISITTIDSEGHPSVTVWDRCGLPQNIQDVFGTNTPQMTKDISRFMVDGFAEKYGSQPDSIRLAFETFDYCINANEHNNAIFPVLMKCGFEGEYKAMKDSLLSQLMRGEITSDEAVSRYVFWFYKNFDRHTNCSSQTFWNMEKDVIVNYRKLIPNYAPEPVGCKVDDETYLLRLPSCMGDVPTDEWMEKKEAEFKQSGCKYLILDLRGNGGGSDHISMLFTWLMCEGNMEKDFKCLYMVSTENNRRLKKYCEAMPGSYHQDVMKEALVIREGSLINWLTWPKGSMERTAIVKKGAIIIDNYTASAGESPVRWIREYPKSRVKVYGRERTNGCDQTGNVNTIRLPHSNISLTYPMTVDDIFEDLCREKNPGHKPDVIIPLPYPEQLTDNIDPWVLWVAKKMK
ncbi:MAG: hypothetical protein IJ897_09480 [Prevotella sp.]|nr:hypothetical protein [Prevotella sp.]